MISFKSSIDFIDKPMIIKKSIAASTAEPLKATHKKVKIINIWIFSKFTSCLIFERKKIFKAK